MNFVSYPNLQFATLRDVPVVQETFISLLNKILHIELSTSSGSWVSLNESKTMLDVFSACFNANPNLVRVPLMQLKTLPGALCWSEVADKAIHVGRKFFSLRECFFGLALCLCADKKTFFDGKKHVLAIPLDIDQAGVITNLALCEINDFAVSARPNRIFIADMESYRAIAEKNLIYWFTFPNVSPRF